MTDTPAWFEDEFEQRPRRRLVVVGAAVAVAWTVVAIAVLASGDEGAQTAGADPAGSGAAAPATSEDSHGEARSGDDPAPGEDGSDGGPPTRGDGGPAPGEDGRIDTPSPGATTVSRDEAEATAVAVARAWLSDGGPDLHVPGVEVHRRAYLEHVTVEGFDLSGPELAVARVQLLLLVREDEHYTEVVVRRAAIPLTLSDAVVTPAGQPWFLPGAPELATAAPATTPVDDPDVATSVEETLVAAGYLDAEVGPVEATPDGSLVAQVAGRTPEGELVDGPVWLASTPGGLVLLGNGDV